MQVVLSTNTECEATLTPFGAEQWNLYIAGIPRQDTKQAGDVMVAPMWEFMAVFGHVMFMGNVNVPFVNNRLMINTERGT